MPATETQIMRFRRYFIDPDGDIWSDEEIDAIFDEVTEDNPDAESKLTITYAKIAGIDELRMDAAKLGKFQVVQHMEDQTTVFKALTQMRAELLEERDGFLSSAAGSAVRMGHLRRKPTWKDVPRA